MSELSDATSQVLGLPAWTPESVVTGVEVDSDEGDDGRLLRVRPIVLDLTPARGSLALAEPPASSLPVLGRLASVRSRIAPYAWMSAELATVLLGCLLVAWALGAAVLAVPLAVAATVVAYRSRHTLAASAHPSSVVRDLSVVFSLVALAVALELVPTAALSQSALVLACAAAVILSATVVRRRVRSVPRVLVVGDRAGISRAAMRWSDGGSVEVVAGVRNDPGMAGGPALTIVGVPTIAGLDRVPALVRRHRVDLVVVSSGDGVADRDLRRLSWLLEGTRAELVVLDAVGGADPHRVVPVRLAGATGVRVLPSTPSAPVRLAKAALDRVLGTLLFLVSLPLLGLLVLLVRLDSAGPGLFKQVRIGRDGTPFVMYKIRTMTKGADGQLEALLERNEASGPLFKLHDDPRVTRVGGFLRKTSLDELAQLINVVRGDMSLVGPRPALPSEVEHYDDVELRRLAVRPGITGLWQVSGRSDLTWDAGMSLDLRYADNWRIRGDASILARTFGAVLRRRGAY
jgi:exopolysaccharide biosynthesis polyprenyl glycosylphosphotransferase